MAVAEEAESSDRRQHQKMVTGRTAAEGGLEKPHTEATGLKKELQVLKDQLQAEKAQSERLLTEAVRLREGLKGGKQQLQWLHMQRPPERPPHPKNGRQHNSAQVDGKQQLQRLYMQRLPERLPHPKNGRLRNSAHQGR